MIEYFSKRPLVANVLMIGIIGIALLCWQQISKEEMPEFEMDWLRIRVSYPGATAEDVEQFVIKPIEENLKIISGIEYVFAKSTYSNAIFNVSFEPKLTDLKDKIQEVKESVNAVSLPNDIKNIKFRQFKSSEKSIIDIGVYLKDKDVLDLQSRMKLQKYVLAFQNQLISLREISGVKSDGYLQPEIQIKVDAKKLEQYSLTMEQLISQINRKNIRSSLGMLEDEKNTEITIVSELKSIEDLRKLIVSSGFSGQTVSLGQLAQIEKKFEKNDSILKVQSHEGIVLNVQKSMSIDILTAQESVLKFIDTFKKTHAEQNIGFVIIDDESYDVKNRLSLISTNGLIGFFVIIVILLIFLDLRSGIWVALGVPFCLAFTVICSLALGYTVNNMTLASIIIVLGIVVDDAIIVAENIIRKKDSVNNKNAINAVKEMIAPIVASVLTTCAAFFPLYFFNGRFGQFIKHLPVIISLMLIASVFESFFILPSHMLNPSRIEHWILTSKLNKKIDLMRDKYIQKIESSFAKLLEKIFPFRLLWIMFFLTMMGGSIYVYKNEMKFVMFPREEARFFRLKVVADRGIKKEEMAEKITPIEKLFLDHKYVTSVRTSIGKNRRGNESKEHTASMRIEIVPPSERDISLNKLIESWKKKLDTFEGFKKIDFQKNWFGSSSGSPIVIEVQENNDQTRDKIANLIKEKLEKFTYLSNVEIEKSLVNNQYVLNIKKEEASRLGVDFSKLAETLRVNIAGKDLFTMSSGLEEITINISNIKENKNNIDDVMSQSVENSKGFLIPIKQLVDPVLERKPNKIERINYNRTINIYSDISENFQLTPLEAAVDIEKTIFPDILKISPTTNLVFRGEVEDSRNSKSDFMFSIAMILLLIFILLVFLFDSLVKPLIIGSIIPFGFVGAILSFWLHGYIQFGFFAVIGCLGMIGVVINDSIVLIDKYKQLKEFTSKKQMFSEISQLTSKRLRAVIITTVTTVAGLFPTAYGLGGYDSMLAEMMLAMGWGLMFGVFITLLLVPCLYSFYFEIQKKFETN